MSESNSAWLVEQRYRAVLEINDGHPVTEVALRYGVSRQSVYNWKDRYAASGIDGLKERSRRPRLSPTRLAAELEAMICQLRRQHPRWGARRIRYELGRSGVPTVPSRATVHRVLGRNGLVNAQEQTHKRKYKRWQREAPMQLWQMDIVGGVFLADGRECKLVTGIDDHSRYIVIAKVVIQPTGRAVCEAFTEAMQRFGVPSEVLTDNGKQFTGRFTRPRPAEVLFERICRENGISQRLTKRRSPTTTGKIERWHKTLRLELLDHTAPFENLATAQQAIDTWVGTYNHQRPHQALDMATPASRFRPSYPENPNQDNEIAATTTPAVPDNRLTVIGPPAIPAGAGAVAFEVRVPPCGHFHLLPDAQHVWLGPAWAGRIITVWADERSVHLLADAQHIKTLPSRLNTDHLAAIIRRGARPGGPPPAAPAIRRVNGRLVLGAGEAVEVDRSVVRDGIIAIANQTFTVNPDLVGQRITLRLDGHLMHAIAHGRLVGSWPCPIPIDRLPNITGARLATTTLPAMLPTEPVHVQRRVPKDGITMVARQRLRLGAANAGKIVTVIVEDTHFRVLHNGEQLSIHPRTTDRMPNIRKAHATRRTIMSNQN